MKRNMSPEEVTELFNNIKYPEKDIAVLDENGKIIYKTKLYFLLSVYKKRRAVALKM